MEIYLDYSCIKDVIYFLFKIDEKGMDMVLGFLKSVIWL